MFASGIPRANLIITLAIVDVIYIFHVFYTINIATVHYCVFSSDIFINCLLLERNWFYTGCGGGKILRRWLDADLFVKVRASVEVVRI